MRSPLVTVGRLTATAGGRTLLDRIDLTVSPGEVTALVGPSGSGKTTAALALLGEAGPGIRLSGEVIAGGNVVVDGGGPAPGAADVRGRVVAYMPQHPGSSLNPARRIGTVLTELARLHHAGGVRAADQSGRPEVLVAQAMAAAQLPVERRIVRRFPHQFSGGQRQRIALAQALVCGPRVLALDEPSTGLDTVTRMELVATLRRLVDDGLGILLLSHDHDLIRALADHVVVLQSGMVAGSGPPSEVLPARPDRLRWPTRATPPCRFGSDGARGMGCPGVSDPRSDPTPRRIGSDGARGMGCPGVSDPRSDPTPRRIGSDGAREAGCPGVSESRPGVLGVEGLTVWVGRQRVLEGVEFEVPAGGRLGIVGRSGSGKTTIARCVAGLHERYDGRISLDGSTLPVLRRRTTEQTRRVQYVWQEVRGSFDDRRPVHHQVARTAERLRAVRRTESSEQALALLDRLGVAEPTATRTPGSLSGGELQRAALARALLAEPDVLICDEITTALDDRTTDTVLDLLRELGSTLIWIGHDLGLVATVADQVLVLDAGRVVERGIPDTIMSEPQTPAAMRLLRAATLGRRTPPATTNREGTR